MLSDHSAPVLVGDDEAARKVAKSTIPLSDLVVGKISADEIEIACSSQGCGAVLVRLDELNSNLYETFYRLQWQLGSRAFDHSADANDAAARFAALDLPVRLLLCRCAVGVARARMRLTGASSRSPESLQKLTRGPLAAAVGRPLLANRQEFHPSVDWLLRQQQAGRLQREEHPEITVVADTGPDQGSPAILGRVQADEVQLFDLYQEWNAARPEEQCGHGNKYNGDIYYGAFRGRTHVDSGSTMTLLFGPGEVRDLQGWLADGGPNCRQYGGHLIVKPPADERFAALPYRLPCGSPYVVAFFNDTDGIFEEPNHVQPSIEIGGVDNVSSGVHVRNSTAVGIDTHRLGWSATAHGVSRIVDRRFSRGQAVLSLRLTNADVT